jgi:ABC-type transport system involved in multi-copper enzyme maturation permease subunit
MNIARIWAIAANGFREVIRDRILYVIGFFAISLAFAMRLLPEISVGADRKILLDLGLALSGVLGAVVAIFVGTGLINKEIEKKTVLVLIPKPLSRAELIAGKHFGLVGVLGVMIAIMTGIYLLAIHWLAIPFSLVSLLVAQVFLTIELALLTAVAIAFGVFTSSTLATLMSFGFYLMGHISQDILKLGAISQNKSIESATKLIYLVLPDLERLNLRNEAIYGVLPSISDLIASGLYGLLYTLALLIIAIAIFSRRQF